MSLWLYFSLACIGYAFVLYPCIVYVLGSFSGKAPSTARAANKSADDVCVSFIVAVHNGENIIQRKILNSLRCNYVDAKIEYIFVCDGCTDATETIVQQYPEIRLLSLPERHGKEFALQHAIAHAAGEILVFSDAGIALDSDAIELLASHFGDPTVGAVSSYDHLADSYLSIGRLFVAFEMFLRNFESRISSCVGVSGSLFAARSSLCQELDANSCSDLEIALICVRRGYRAIIDKSVKGAYKNSRGTASELVRKQRTIAQGITTVIRNADMLNPFSCGIFAWQLFSHKVMRWFAPFFVFLLMGYGAFYTITAASLLQYIPPLTLFAVILLLAGIRAVRTATVQGVSYFVVCHVATFTAIVALLRGKRFSIWEPTKR